MIVGVPATELDASCHVAGGVIDQQKGAIGRDRYGDQTDDVPGRWLEALITGLAYDLSRKRPPFDEGLIQRLKGEAAEAEDKAQRADRGRQRFRYKIGGR